MNPASTATKRRRERLLDLVVVCSFIGTSLLGLLIGKLISYYQDELPDGQYLLIPVLIFAAVVAFSAASAAWRASKNPFE